MTNSIAMPIAVIIPCFRVRRHILDVLARIGPEVSAIYVVDDACPDGTADLVEQEARDPRIRVIRRAENGGVGTATLQGMTAAAEQGAKILVKIDGDGQMNPALIPGFVAPLLAGTADMTKGNRFYSTDYVRGMPASRIFGNGVLSFMSKLSSGYWSLLDPTNGFIALHASVFTALPGPKLAPRYFFESDLLFRLNLLRANVVDIPMRAAYGDEASNLRIGSVILPFLWCHLRNFVKRVTYTYFIRDFSIASLYLVFGIPLFLFGVTYGLYEWFEHARDGILAPAGTVMLAALPVITGFQLLLAFLTYDVSSTPRIAVHRDLAPNQDLEKCDHDRKIVPISTAIQTGSKKK